MAKKDTRKSVAEARVERFTWFLMVLVFALLHFAQKSESIDVPHWLIPFAGAVILLGSGFYQYQHRWHVSPITWIAGTLLFVLVLVNFQDKNLDFYGFTLLTFAAVIGFGVLTGET